MIRSLVAATVLAAGLVAGGSAFTASSAAPQPAFRGPGGVYEMHLKLLRAIDAGDEAKVCQFFAESTAGVGVDANGRFGDARGFGAFVLDGKGKPVSCDGVHCAADCLAKWGGEGWTTRITDGWMDCPTSNLSYATLELERTCTVGDGVEVRRFRLTSLVRHTKTGFKVWQMHLSPAG